MVIAAVNEVFKPSSKEVLYAGLIDRLTSLLEGETDEIVRNLTVVEVGDISLPGAPDDGLVVTRGSSVLLKVDCLPAGAESFVSTLWESRRLRHDLMTYDDWSYAASVSRDDEVTYAPGETVDIAIEDLPPGTELDVSAWNAEK